MNDRTYIKIIGFLTFVFTLISIVNYFFIYIMPFSFSKIDRSHTPVMDLFLIGVLMLFLSWPIYRLSTKYKNRGIFAYYIVSLILFLFLTFSFSKIYYLFSESTEMDCHIGCFWVLIYIVYIMFTSGLINFIILVFFIHKFFSTMNKSLKNNMFHISELFFIIGVIGNILFFILPFLFLFIIPPFLFLYGAIFIFIVEIYNALKD